MPHAESFSIASNSKPGLCYTVTRSQGNDWQCTCPHWTYRRTECAHIRTAQSLPATESIHKPEPPIVYAHVREVTPQPDGSLYVPLLPIGDSHFLYTLCFDLYAHGILWASILERYRLPRSFSRDTCVAFIEQHGRKISQFSDNPALPRHQYQILSGIPLPDIPRYQETPVEYHSRTGYPLDLCQRYLHPLSPT